MIGVPPAPGAGRRWRLVALVSAGGALGTAAREALGLLLPDLDGVPVAILLINVAGAFLLGALTGSLHRSGAAERARLLQLGLGTGFCGGFTTYSALAAGTAALLLEGRPVVAGGYLVATLLLGAFAAWGGIAVGTAAARR